MIDSPLRLLLGLATGVVFGFLLQKGRVAKHSVIVGQLLLRDFTVLKIMLTAIAVGAAGFWTLVALDITAVEVKPAQLGGILSGGLLFGVGLAVLGYCPGTTVAAVGEGHRDAVAGLLGMIAGAFVFVGVFPISSAVQKAAADWGKITVPDVTHIAPGVWIAILLAAITAVYAAPRLRRQRHNH